MPIGLWAIEWTYARVATQYPRTQGPRVLAKMPALGFSVLNTYKSPIPLAVVQVNLQL